MKTATIQTFEFDELGSKAKETARAWYREGAFQFDWYDFVYEDANTVAGLLGIDIYETPSRGLHIFFSGFCSQGDGACFEGTWRAFDVKVGQMKEHAPEDATLHRIAGEFEKVAKQFPNALFSVKHRGHYSHQYCTDFDVEIRDADDVNVDSEEATTAEKALIEAARDFMAWIYRQLEQEFTYQNSDEAVDESIRANEYTFTSNGKRFAY